MNRMLKNACVACLLMGGISLHAEIKAVTMHTMLDGMNLVQQGFLMNSLQMIESGVTEIESGKAILTTVEPGHFLSFDEAKANAYTKEISANISLHAQMLLQSYKEERIPDAVAAYNGLMQQCLDCHMKLRDYKDRGVLSDAKTK